MPFDSQPAVVSPVVLPDKPSALIRLALTDLQKALSQPDVYTINMDRGWHLSRTSYNQEWVCSVCLAGAVMAFSLDVPPTVSTNLDSFPAAIGRKLAALNSFRVGNVLGGLRHMGFSTEVMCDVASHIDAFRIPVPYYGSPTMFMMDMAGMADTFESLGL